MTSLALGRPATWRTPMRSQVDSSFGPARSIQEERIHPVPQPADPQPDERRMRVGRSVGAAHKYIPVTASGVTGRRPQSNVSLAVSVSQPTEVTETSERRHGRERPNAAAIEA
jgi:hypothetical protein